DETGEEVPRCTYRGTLLPQMFVDAHLNTSSAEEILRDFEHYLENKAHHLSYYEKKVLKQIAHVTFDPETSSNIMVPLKDGFDLLKSLHLSRQSMRRVEST